MCTRFLRPIPCDWTRSSDTVCCAHCVCVSPLAPRVRHSSLADHTRRALATHQRISNRKTCARVITIKSRFTTTAVVATRMEGSGRMRVRALCTIRPDLRVAHRAQHESGGRHAPLRVCALLFVLRIRVCVCSVYMCDCGSAYATDVVNNPTISNSCNATEFIARNN